METKVTFLAFPGITALKFKLKSIHKFQSDRSPISLKSNDGNVDVEKILKNL